MTIRSSAALAGVLALLLAACGPDGNEAREADQSTAAEAPAAQAARTPAPPGAAVFFVEPLDGARVKSPLTIKFGISGMSVAPAGDRTPNTGHHHLLIDTELADPSQPVPSDPQHLHFGKGQTEVSLELSPGQHRLQLVLGDAQHVPHDPPVISKPITITVE